MSKHSTVSLVLFVGVLGHRDMGFECPDNTPTDWTACPQNGILCSYSGGGASGRYACNSWSQWQQLSGGQCLDANGNVYNQGQYDPNGEQCLNGNFPSQNLTPAPPTGGCMFYGSSMSVGTQVHGEDIGMGPGCEWARCTSFPTGNRWDCTQFGAAGTKLGAAGITHQPYRSESPELGEGGNGRPGDCPYYKCDYFGYCLATRTWAHAGELQNPMSCGGEGNWAVCQFGPNRGNGVMDGASWQCAESAPAPGAAMADDSTSLGAAGNRHQPYRSEKLGAAGNRHQPYRSEKLGDGQPCDGSPETCEGAACGSSMCTLTTYSGHMCVPQGTTTSPSNVPVTCAVRETAVCGQCPSLWGQVGWCCQNPRVGAAGITHQPYRSEKLGTFYKPPPRLAVLGDGDNGDCNYDQCDFFGDCLATGVYAHGGELQNPMNCEATYDNWVVCQFGANPGTGVMAGAEWQCAESAPAPGAAMADASDATSLGAAGIRHQPYRSEKLGTFYKPPPRLAVLGAAGIRHQPYRSTAVSLGASYPAPRGSGPGITNIPAANTHSSVQDVQGVVVCYTAEGQPRLPTSAVRNANINQLATCIGPQWRYTPLCQIRNQQFCWSNCANNVGATCMNNCACV